MAEANLGISVKASTGQAESEFERLGGSIRNLGTKALEAGNLSKDGLQQLATAAAKVDPALAKIAKQAFDAQSALDQMGRAGDNADRIESAATKAQVKINDLKESLQRAKEAGVDLGPGIEKSMAAMDGAIGKAVVRSAELRDKFDSARKSIEALKGPSADAWAELEKIGPAGLRAAESMRALERAGDSPRELQKAAAMAAIALEDVQNSASRVGPGVAAALGKAGQAVQEAADKARRFADVAGDLRTKGDLAAKGMEGLSGAAGSLEAILGRLKDTGTAFQGKIADVGFGVISFGSALSFGYEQGRKFDGFLRELGVNLGGFQKFTEGSIVESLKLAGVLKDAIPIYQQMDETTRAAGEAHMEFSRRASTAINALADAGKLTDWRKAVGGLTSDIDNWSLALQKAAKSGPQELANVVTYNKDTLLKLGEAIRKAGIDFADLEPPVARAIRAAEQMAEADRKAAAEKEKLAAAQQKLREQLELKLPEFMPFNETGKVLGSLHEIENALLAAKKALHPDDFKNYAKANEESLRRWAEILKREGMEIPKLWKEILDGFDTSKWLDEQAAKWDEFRAIQQSAATDAQKPLRDLVTAYNDLAAAQAAAFKAGDSEGVEELRARMSANLAAQAEATQKLAEAAREAGVALGAMGTVTVGNADAVERAIQQTEAWRAAQEDLNRAFREGEFRLQGINWEIRRAKETTVELSKAQEDFIEALARNSDANPQTQLWFGRMILQLEEDMKKGKASFADFEKTIQEFFRAMSRLNMEVPGLIDLTKLSTQMMEVMRILEGYRG